MRFMVIVKATEDSEAGVMPTSDLLAAMGAFNQELVDAGVLVAGDGLRPSRAGTRVHYDADGAATVVDGPFTETKELVSGYWVLEVSSRQEAVEWLRRAPFRNGSVEIREFVRPEDFGEAFTPELQERERAMREASGARRRP